MQGRFTSVRFTERLEEIGARPSIGTVADSYDHALAETTDGLYKTECVHGPDAPRPWAHVDELELATLSWAHWFNEDRLHGHCKDVPPAEYEAAFYSAQHADPTGAGTQEPEPPSDQGGSDQSQFVRWAEDGVVRSAVPSPVSPCGSITSRITDERH